MTRGLEVEMRVAGSVQKENESGVGEPQGLGIQAGTRNTGPVRNTKEKPLERVLLMRNIKELDPKLEILRGKHAEKRRMRVRKVALYMYDDSSISKEKHM
jgi:hypothetical protein